MDCREHVNAVHGRSSRRMKSLLRDDDRHNPRGDHSFAESLSSTPTTWNASHHKPFPIKSKSEHEMKEIEDDDLTTCSVSTAPRRHLSSSFPTEKAEMIHHDSPYGPATSVYPRAVAAQARKSWQQQEALLPQLEVLDISSTAPARGEDDPAADPAGARYRPKTERGRPFAPNHEILRSDLQEWRRSCKPCPPSGSFRKTSSSYPVPYKQRHHYYEEKHLYSLKKHPPKHPPMRDNTKKNKNSKVVWIEISPGVRVRLRGAAETRACIARDFFLPHLCFSCSLEVFCIQDASYLLCPQCRVVNPVATHDDFTHDGGLGLGFTIEELARIQEELRREERELQRDERQVVQRQSRTSFH